MMIEEEIFRQYNVNKKRLIDYGFVPVGEKLVFEKKLSSYDFKIVIEYNEHITGKIFDLLTEEEYTNYRIETAGGFTHEIKEKFIELLTDIRDKCAIKQLFITQQALKINKYITEKYKDEPEFLWKNFPTYAIYRNKNSQKWYALIGTAALNKVNRNSKSKEPVEIINVKVDKNDIEKLLKQKGIYEAYHMNKKNWVTIIFDGTLKDFEIQTLVDNSYKNI